MGCNWKGTHQEMERARDKNMLREIKLLLSL